MDLIEQIFTKRQHCFNYNLRPRWRAMHTHRLSQTSACSPAASAPFHIRMRAGCPCKPLCCWALAPPCALWLSVFLRQGPRFSVATSHCSPCSGQRRGSFHPPALGPISVSPTHPSLQGTSLQQYSSLSASVVQSDPANLGFPAPSPSGLASPASVVRSHWKFQSFADGGTPVSKGVSLGCCQVSHPLPLLGIYPRTSPGPDTTHEHFKQTSASLERGMPY